MRKKLSKSKKRQDSKQEADRQADQQEKMVTDLIPPGRANLPALRPLSRILAAFLDYVLVRLTFNTIAVSSGIPYDLQYLIPLIFGLAYYVVGNSCVARGQTIGKLLFGLQTRSVRKYRSQEARAELAASDAGESGSASSLQLLTLSESTVRYLIQFGILIALIELPETAYRYFALEAPYWVLNIHIFLGATFLLASLFCWAVTPFHLAFHDLCARSIVVPKIVGPEFKVFTECKIGKGYLAMSLTCGLALGGFIYVMSVDPNTAVSQFSRYRYKIENAFPVRLGFKSVDGQTLSIGVVVLPEKGVVLDSWLATNLTKFGVEIGAVNPSETESLDWVMLPLNTSHSDIDARRRFLVKTRTLDVQELPVDDPKRSSRK